MNRDAYIYSITNTQTKTRYIGSSVNITSRWHNHRSHLKHNKHHCTFLQKAWNKHGKECFVFEILETLPAATWRERLECEIKWLGKFKTYNSRTANVFLTNFENTPETRRKIKEGVNNSAAIAAYRKTHSGRMKEVWRDPETRAVYLSAINKSRKSLKARSHQSKLMAEAWTDPKRRKQLLDRTYSAETRASKAEKMKTYWATPEGRATNLRRIQAIKDYWAKRKLQ